MKPLKLSMTAFGPYKDTEVIDFTKLNEHHLYVISGATGAGKTTIFDGICFALYGAASGSDRENTSMLRSHFADDSVHTAVELTFELNERTYRVLRQLGHVKKGNKSKTGERYEFFEMDDGNETPCVERQIVSEINEKIVQLIGLTHDQFKQIVMLPQGEFRKLLTSETENKEEILRKLFKTARFKQMNELLKDKRDYLQNKLATDQQLINHHISHIPEQLESREDSTIFNILEQENYHITQVIQSLDSEILYYEKKIIDDEKEYKRIANKFTEQQKNVFEASELNKKFLSLKQKKTELQHLQQQKNLFVNKEEALEAARRANGIEPYEKHYQERKKELRNYELHVQEAKKQLIFAKTTLDKAKKHYINEENKQNMREQVQRDLDKYVQFLPVVKDIEVTREKLIQYEKSQAMLEKECKLLKASISAINESLDNRNKNMKQLEEQVVNLNKKQTEIVELRVQYKQLDEYEQLFNKEKQLKERKKEKELAFQAVNNTYEENEKMWVHNQAYVLASQLQEGQDCPVCGSIHHPKKAESIGEVVTKETLDKLKREVEQKRTEYSRCYGQYNSCYEQLQRKTKEIEEEYHLQEHQIPDRKKQIFEQGKTLRTEVEQLEQFAKTLETLRKEQQDEENKVRNHQKQMDSKLKTYEQAKNLFLTENATFKERIRNIPEEVQQLEKLENVIHTLKQKKEKLEQQWKTAQSDLKVAEENNTKAHFHVSNGEKELTRLEKLANNAQNEYLAQLNKGKFESEQSYKEAKLSMNDQSSLEKEIKDYKQTVTVVSNQIKELKAELTGKKRLNIEDLESQLKQLKVANDQAFERLNKSRELLTNVNKLQKTLVKLNARTEKLERELSTVIELYDILRGQNNRKISLERYLQIDFLEQIMRAANGRFRNLTNGQYYLLRSNRQESHGRQSGLAIDVYDAYTAQTRDVKTLSGGEKFIASLCLALGMADVIQSYQGSVSIETMFIDEGFGSLDEESLHKAIDALVNLQQDGRTIGVISHVDELKSIFPAMLAVSKSQEGYSHTKFVVK